MENGIRNVKKKKITQIVQVNHLIILRIVMTYLKKITNQKFQMKVIFLNSL